MQRKRYIKPAGQERVRLLLDLYSLHNQAVIEVMQEINLLALPRESKMLIAERYSKKAQHGFNVIAKCMGVA